MLFSRISKVVAAAGLLVFVAFSSQAQEFYARAGGGYNFGLNSLNSANLTITRTGNPQNQNQRTVETAERVKINYGKGISASVALGCMFNEQVGAELEASYLKGGDNETLFQSFSENATFGFDSASTQTNAYARMLLLQPSVVLRAELTEKAELYGKFGISVSKGHVVSVSDIKAGQQEFTQTRYEGGWGFGFQAAMGLAFNLNEHYGFYSEVKMSNLAYSPTNARLEKKIRNGKDITDSEPRDTPLEDAYTSVNGQSNVLLKPEFPFSYVGLHLGLKYTF